MHSEVHIRAGVIPGIGIGRIGCAHARIVVDLQTVWSTRIERDADGYIGRNVRCQARISDSYDTSGVGAYSRACALGAAHESEIGKLRHRRELLEEVDADQVTQSPQIHLGTAALGYPGELPRQY